MSFTLHATRFAPLVAISFVSFAQNIASESVRPNTVVIQLQDARAWETAEHRYLQALDVAATAQGDQRLEVYRIYLSLASLYQAERRYTEEEKYSQLAYDLANTLFVDQSPQAVEALN